jgi:cytoplasmic iron level regulating protein YaaA (DUF328/UPF0246 family)
MITLLSPAKAIDCTKRLQTDESTTPTLINEAAVLAKKMSNVSARKIGKMMHLSTDLAQLNYERYQNWSEQPEISDKAGHVGAIFNGEAYRGLDATSFTKKELAVAQKKVRILSGLYGILKPLDVIHPYRLEMGTSWAVTPKKKNLYLFWGKKIAEELNAEESDVIVNLASAEYFKAVDKKTIKPRIITPTFKDFKNGEYKVIMVFAKQSRGAMARYIVENNITDPEQLKLFDVGGYQYDDNLSEGDNWVFTR